MKAMRKLKGMEDPGVRALLFGGGGRSVGWTVPVELGAAKDWRAMVAVHGRELEGAGAGVNTDGGIGSCSLSCLPAPVLRGRFGSHCGCGGVPTSHLHRDQSTMLTCLFIRERTYRRSKSHEPSDAQSEYIWWSTFNVRRLLWKCIVQHIHDDRNRTGPGGAFHIRNSARWKYLHDRLRPQQYSSTLVLQAPSLLPMAPLARYFQHELERP